MKNINHKICKALLLVFGILMFNTNTKAQTENNVIENHECGEDMDAVTYSKYRQMVSGEQSRLHANKGPQSVFEIPVQFHCVRNSNGSDGLSQVQVDSALMFANIKFAPAGIHFFQCQPVHYINNDSLNATKFVFKNKRGCADTTVETKMTRANNVLNVANIYFVYTDGWNWAALPGSAANCFDWVILKKSNYKSNWVIAHELGHYFNLLHTFNTRKVNGVNVKENITRNTGAACYNADTEGDLISDTQADPYLAKMTVFDNVACTYIGSFTDDCGNSAYQTDPANLMGYANGCQQYFSQGQIDRMRDAAQNTRNYLKCDKLSDCIADYNLTGIIDTNYSWQAFNTIVADAQLKGNALMAFDAQNSVQLNVGFEAKAGVSFTAMLDGCFGNRIYYRAANTTSNNVSNNEIIQVNPNPAASFSYLKFNLTADEKITATIIDNTGKCVLTLARNELMQQGENTLSVDALQLTNGIYQCVIQSSTWVKSTRLVIVH